MKMIFLHSNVSAKENSVEAAYIREKLSSEIAKKSPQENGAEFRCIEQ